MKIALFILYICLATAVGNQIGTFCNNDPSTSFKADLYILGHECYSMSLKANGGEGDWHAGGYTCQANVDSVLLYIANTGLTCTLRYNNLYQTDPVTNQDIWNAISIFTGFTDDNEICVSTSIVAYGNAIPVSANSTCTTCAAPSSRSLEEPQHTFAQVKNGHSDTRISYRLYNPDYCYSSWVSAGNDDTWHTGPGIMCTEAVSRVEFTADGAVGCNATVSSANGAALSFLTNIINDRVCVKGTAASAGNLVSIGGDCPVCFS